MLSGSGKRGATTSDLMGSNPTRAGDYNERVVLEAVRTRGTATSSEIAAATGLTHQAAINIVKRLLATEMLIDVGKTSGARGQPASRYNVNARGAYALGLTIDREHVSLVVLNLLGEIKHRVARSILFPSPEDVLDFVQKETAEIYARRIVPRRRVTGLGIAMPDDLAVPSFPDKPEAFERWTVIDFPAMCAKVLNLPVYLENDATAAAIGEHQFGQGSGLSSFIYVLISAGLGCGIVINGQSYSRGKNHAGEIGNIPVGISDGQRQILWDTVSLPGLYREIGRKGVSISSPDQVDLSVPAIADAVELWIQKAVGVMVVPFITINYVLSPQMVFIGGQLPEVLVDRLCARLNHAVAQYETRTPITPFSRSTVAADASALGAAVAVFQQHLLP